MIFSKLLILEAISKWLWFTNYSASDVTDYEMGDPGSVPKKFWGYCASYHQLRWVVGTFAASYPKRSGSESVEA